MMSRLQAEWQRLYLAPQAVAPAAADTAADDTGLVDPEGRVRALVLEVAGPPDWPRLSAVWQGVQTDLACPAPAIAVTGRDGHQLWFSLERPVPLAAGQAFLQALCRRYLGDLAPARLRLAPPAARVPAQQASGYWSAFVVAGLAPLFADEPWLDTPPSPDAQADLLSRLQSLSLADFQAAQALLMPADVATPAPAPAPAPAAPVGPAVTPGVAQGRDARRFLQDVMNDPAVDLALRIEAAKALLPYA